MKMTVINGVRYREEDVKRLGLARNKARHPAKTKIEAPPNQEETSDQFDEREEVAKTVAKLADTPDGPTEAGTDTEIEAEPVAEPEEAKQEDVKPVKAKKRKGAKSESA